MVATADGQVAQGYFDESTHFDNNSYRSRHNSYTISKSLYRINRTVHPDPVGAVLRRTRPNAICIPNRTWHNQKQCRSAVGWVERD